MIAVEFVGSKGYNLNVTFLYLYKFLLRVSIMNLII